MDPECIVLSGSGPLGLRRHLSGGPSREHRCAASVWHRARVPRRRNSWRTVPATR